MRICQTEPKKSNKRCLSLRKKSIENRMNQIARGYTDEGWNMREKLYRQPSEEQERKSRVERRNNQIYSFENAEYIPDEEEPLQEIPFEQPKPEIIRELLPQNSNFIIHIAIGACFLLVILFMISNNYEINCTELYKQGKCWENTKSKDPSCMKLAKCIQSAQNFPYREELMATLAGLAFVIKKYWRQILQFLPKMIKR